MGKPEKQSVAPKPEPLAKKIWPQVGAILGLSLGLGLAFNVSNPIGIRWATQVDSTEPVWVTNATPAVPALAQQIPAKSNSQPSVPSITLLPPMPPTSAPTPLPSPAEAAARPVILPLQPQPSPAAAPSITLSQTAAVPTQPSAPVNYATPISWLEAKPLVEGGRAVLVDARTKPSYDAGHIPGAIPLPEVSPLEEFKAFVQKYGTNTQVIVYCSSTSCSISRRVAERLIREFGFTTARYITGGYQEWQKAELATLKPGS